MPRSRVRLALLLAVALAAFSGCQAAKDAPSAGPAAAQAPARDAKEPSKTLAGATRARPDNPRKVIYKAELSLEVRSPGDAQARVTSVVEREGGFVASASRIDAEGQSGDVTLVLRVPAERFSAVLAEIRRLGIGKRAERIDSDDVTDEYVDLEARLRVQTRLEEQLLELLKTATSVEAALKVHHELANARTEIERIQGKKQLLEREVAMSTIRLTLSTPPVQSVSSSKFAQSVSAAYSDTLLVASGIVVGVIRLTGIFVPIVVMLGVPGILIVLLVRRWMRKVRRKTELTP